MFVVIVDFGRLVKKFHSRANALAFFEALSASHHSVWLMSAREAVKTELY